MTESYQLDPTTYVAGKVSIIAARRINRAVLSESGHNPDNPGTEFVRSEVREQLFAYAISEAIAGTMPEANLEAAVLFRSDLIPLAQLVVRGESGVSIRMRPQQTVRLKPDMLSGVGGEVLDHFMDAHQQQPNSGVYGMVDSESDQSRLVSELFDGYQGSGTHSAVSQPPAAWHTAVGTRVERHMSRLEQLDLADFGGPPGSMLAVRNLFFTDDALAEQVLIDFPEHRNA